MPALLSSRRVVCRLLPTIVLCGFAYYQAGAGDENPSADQVRKVDSATRQVRLSSANSLLLEYPDWLTSVKSQDPAVIRVSAVRPNRLRITRLAAGTAVLQAVDRRDLQYSFEVVVPDSADQK